MHESHIPKSPVKRNTPDCSPVLKMFKFDVLFTLISQSTHNKEHGVTNAYNNETDTVYPKMNV